MSQAFRALSHRSFRLYAFGLVVSLIGTMMHNTAQSWLVYRLIKSELALGTTVFVNHLPALLLGPIAGIVADRYSRRRIVLWTQSLFLIQAVILATLTLTGHVTWTWVLILAASLGVVNAFDVPTRQSLIPQLVPKDDLLNAIALNSLGFQMARLLGPSLGGFAIALWGEGVCFALNAASFLAVLLVLTRIDTPGPPPIDEATSTGQRLREGLHYAWTHAEVRDHLILSAAVNICSASVLVLGPIFADALFHQGPRGFGILISGLATGAIVGMLGLASRDQQRKLDGVILISTILAGVAFLAFSQAPSFLTALAITPLMGYGYMRQNAATNTRVQTMIPDEMRGRVMGFYSMTVIGMVPLGGLLLGSLAAAAGPRLTMLLCGCGCLLTAAWYCSRDWYRWNQR